MMGELGPDNAFWDGEWISRDEINEQIKRKEWRARFPNADLSIVSVFEDLTSTAWHYHELNGGAPGLWRHRRAIRVHHSRPQAPPQPRPGVGWVP